ncbi:MAG: hypothetical protein WBP57_00715 [Ignavibacteria bacterium]
MTNKTQTPVGNDKVGSPCIFISSHDLADEDIQVCIEALGLEEVLYQIGFDKEHWFNETDSFYEIMECKHKTRSGKVVTGKRYSAYERLDSNWLNSGLASEEAKMMARRDRSYLQEIRNLSKQAR